MTAGAATPDQLSGALRVLPLLLLLPEPLLLGLVAVPADVAVLEEVDEEVGRADQGQDHVAVGHVRLLFVYFWRVWETAADE